LESQEQVHRSLTRGGLANLLTEEQRTRCSVERLLAWGTKKR